MRHGVRVLVHLGVPREAEVSFEGADGLDGGRARHLDASNGHLGRGGVEEEAERGEVSGEADDVVGGIDEAASIVEHLAGEIAGDEVLALGEVALDDTGHLVDGETALLSAHGLDAAEGGQREGARGWGRREEDGTRAQEDGVASRGRRRARRGVARWGATANRRRRRERRVGGDGRHRRRRTRPRGGIASPEVTSAGSNEAQRTN